jgi:XTP/dITP diphosphohydrolase
MAKLVLASGNQGKLREFAQMLAPLGWDVEAQGLHGVTDIEETGLSFVENAILKARHCCAETGLPSLADDSGLEVDALNGAPGIYSARFAGPGANDAINNAELLRQLEGVSTRTARYHCVLVFMRHATDPVPLICHATWEGTLLTAPRGEGGFGYDPLFWLEDHQCTAAELDAAVKNTLSHRGRAMQQLIQALS